MASKSSSPSRHVQDFLAVLTPLTGLSAYSLHGYELVLSYLDELEAELGKKEYRKLLKDTAGFVREQLAQQVPTSVIVRLLVPNQDVVPLTKEAKRLLPVTNQVVALGQDLAAMTAPEVGVTGLSTHTVTQTQLTESALLELRATHGPPKVAPILGKVRDRFEAIQADVAAASRADDVRKPAGGRPLPPMEDQLTERGHVGTAVKVVRRQWAELSAFMQAAGVLKGALPGDLRGVTLADQYLTEVRQSLPSATRATIIAAFGEELEKAESKGELAEFVESSRTGRFAPIVAAAVAMVRDVETFIAMSVVLTGVTRIELVETAQSEVYLDRTIRAVGRRLTHELLERARSVIQIGVDDPSLMEVTVRMRLLGDQKLGPIARATMKMWYHAQWEPLPAWWYGQYCPGHPAPTTTIVVSGSAYKVGLAWGLAGAHPQGAHQPGYGSWALPPGTDAVV